MTYNTHTPNPFLGAPSSRSVETSLTEEEKLLIESFGVGLPGNTPNIYVRIIKTTLHCLIDCVAKVKLIQSSIKLV